MPILTENAFGSYEILQALGSGGMGEVYLAHDAKLGRKIAVKVLPAKLADDAALLTRLRHEARSASALNHPNIITIYEVGESERGAYIAMEYVEGKTLREIFDEGPVPLKKGLHYAAQIADGLAAAHSKGLIHRDLKPENLMVTREGLVKILDFGLAKSVSPITTDGDTASKKLGTDPGTLMGTVGYMSPEQVRTQEVDYRSDQFSLGTILYEIFAGKKAFEGYSGVEVLFMIVRDDPEPIGTANPHVPPPLRWIIDRCLAKDPEERYASTRDLARDLQDLRNHLSESMTAPIIGEAIPGRKKINAWMLPLFAIAALLIGLSAGYLLRRPKPPSLVSTRFLTYSGQDYSPAVSSDGKLIAFSSVRDGSHRIWLKQVSEGSEIALTTPPPRVTDDFPRFSPDGSTLIFARFENGRTSIYRIAVLGGEPRKIIDDANSADWAPDGQKVAFVRVLPGANAGSFLGTAGPDGSVQKKIAEYPFNIGQPRWSPDGKRIAVTGTPGRAAIAIYMIDPITGEKKVVAEPTAGGEVSSPAWLSDSRHILYSRADSVEAVVGSTAKVIRHDVISGKAEAIAWLPSSPLVLDVLASGKIVLDVRSPRVNIREMTIGNTDPHDGIWLTRGNSSDRQPAYSPDGEWVVFSSNRSGNLDLWQISRKTGAVRRLTDDAAEDWDPAYTPDGKNLVWSSNRTGNLEIWAAEPDGSGARQVTRDGVDAENPAVTPDKRYIIYNSFNPDKFGLWRINWDGTGAKRLTTVRTAIPEVSPDGQYAVFIGNGRTRDAAINVIRIADGSDTGLLIPTRGVKRTSAILGRARWMPDGKAIAFLSQNAEGVNGVFAQDFIPGKDTTATRRPLAGFDTERATESFGISRDGKTIAIAGWEQLFSLLSAEGLEGVEPPRRKE